MKPSGKFESLFELPEDLKAYVPKTYGLDQAVGLFDGEKPYILRSALNEESGNRLLSGLSLTYGPIKTIDQYQTYLARIKKQVGYKSTILQEYVEHGSHFTIFVTSKCAYAHKTYHPEVFFARTPFSTVGTHKPEDSFSLLLDRLIDYCNSPSLVEVGIKNTQVYLFQINSCPEGVSSQLANSPKLKIMFSNSLMASMSWRDLWKKELLIRFEKEKPNQEEEHERCWRAVFHYFKIYCLMKSLPGNRDSWIQFLKEVSTKNSWLFRTTSTYLKKLNATVSSHSNAFSLLTETSLEPSFFGVGSFEGRPNDVARFEEVITPEMIYTKSDKKILVTSDQGLLSHGILAAIERRVPLVANVSTTDWTSLRQGKYLNINFDRQTICGR